MSINQQAKNPSTVVGHNYPVTNISWIGAKDFCVRAGGALRLPSEAEWEYVCRAGTQTPFHWGSEPDLAKANFLIFRSWAFGEDKGMNQVLPVGSYQPNAWGFFDMHGNVFEWCEDKYSIYPLEGNELPVVRLVPLDASDDRRVLRGGSYLNYGPGQFSNNGGTLNGGCRAAARYSNLPADASVRTGFRVTRCLPE